MEKEFVDGFDFKLPSDRAPDFVKGRLGVNVKRFVEWAEKHVNEKGWVNIDLLVGKSGKEYAALNTYKKTADGDEVKTVDASEIPF